MFLTSAFAQSATTTTEPATTPAITDPAAGEVHTETGVPAGEHAAAFPPFDPTHFPSQLLWLAISFGLFYYLIAKIITPQIGGILEERQKRITADLAAANTMKAEADAAIEAYETDLATAKSKANSIATTARDAAKVKADAERSAIEASLAEKISAAEVNIAAIKAKALAEVGGIAEATVASVVEQLTGTTVSSSEVAAAVSSAAGK